MVIRFVHIEESTPADLLVTPVFKTVGVLSIGAFVFLTLLGLSHIGAVLAMPWLTLAMLRNPGILFAAYLYIPMYKLVTLSVMPVDLTLWLAVLCIARLVWEMLQRRAILINMAVVLWLPFLALLVTSTLTSAYLITSIASLAKTIALSWIPLILVLFLVQERKWLSQFLVVTLAFSTVMSLIGIVVIILDGGSRLSLTSDTINAGRLAILGLLIAPSIVPRNRWKPVVVASIALVTLGASLASGSRGPLLAAFVAAFAIYALPNRWIALRSLMIAGGGILGVAFVMSRWAELVASEQALYRIRALINAAIGNGQLDASSSIRLDLLGRAVEMWGQRPILGWGPGSYAVHRVDGEIAGWSYPHNAVIQAGAELGAIGVFWYLLFIAVAILVIYTQLSDPIVKGIGILTIFAVASAQFSNDLYDNRWMWGMLLLALSLSPVSTVKEADTSANTRLILPHESQDP